MKRIKPTFPLTVSMVNDHPQEVSSLFRKKPPRKKENFIGVCILDGTFLCDDIGALYDSLSIGERLELVYPKEPSVNMRVMPITAVRSDGTEIGMIPFEHSVLPCILASRGVISYCYIEAKRFQGGFASVAVSVYCDKY
ncbi:MAG: hypothetical protein IJB49_03380 [Clostridia bacterium]|nr:hypothetical protein [Clostridia bacterium]